MTAVIRVVNGQWPGRLILAVDPSSRATGWAIADPVASSPIKFAGVIRPPAAWTVRRRTSAIVERLAEVVGQHHPAHAVVEVPSGRPGRGSRAGATGHLAIYGLAVGRIVEMLEGVVRAESIPSTPRDVDPITWVDEREWTRGVKPEVRVGRSRLVAPGLDWSIDHTNDMAEAVGIALWFLARESLHGGSTDAATTAAPTVTSVPIGTTRARRRSGAERARRDR